MEESKKDPVDQNQKPVADDSSKNDLVKHESYMKALNEKKGAQEREALLAEELKILKEEKMAKDGKLGELVENLKAENKTLKGSIKKTNQNYAWSSVTGSIKSAAKAAGCTNPDKLIKLMSDEDLKDLSEGIDENFQVPSESLEALIEKNKKENFFLFTTQEKKTAKGNPITKITGGEGVDLSKMSLAELKEMHKKTYK